MTGERSYIKELRPYSNSYVTFDDRTSEITKGICKLVDDTLSLHVKLR